jgi:hypothetical protein
MNSERRLKLDNQDPQEEIKSTVGSFFAVQKALEAEEASLAAQDERFRSFLQRQKEAKEKMDVGWDYVKDLMIKNDIRSVKGDWGSLTISERLGFDIDESKLPKEFYKLVPDIKMIGDTYRLEGEAPEGAEPKTTKVFTKRLT